MTDPAESLRHPFAAYPMVAAEDATGRVAAVYADAARRLPFVPSILKSLAVCPPYLVLAWQQAAPVLDDPELLGAANAVTDAARTGTWPAVGREAAGLMRQFTDPLARMLLLACGLHAALTGAVSGEPADAQCPPAPDLPLSDGAPSPYDTCDLEAYGRLRTALDTPLVNTIWRKLAASGLLIDTLPAVEAAARATRREAAAVQTTAYRSALTLPWSPVASREALHKAGIGDASAGMAAVLETYIKTLPRVLVLVADL